LAKNIGWNSITGILQHALRYILLFLLAIKLKPHDFGIWGVISIFVTFSNLLVNSGFAKAIIHKKKPKKIQLDTIFFINVGLGLFFYCLIYFSKEHIATFFEMPELSDFIYIGCLIILFRSTNIIQVSLLQKKLRFKRLNLINLFCMAVSFVVSIYSAYVLNYKVLAILNFYLCNSLLITAILWYQSDWRPRLNFSLSSITDMFNFSKYILLNQLFVFITKNIDTILIAKFYSSKVLGVYNISYNIINIPNKFIKGKISEVLFATFSKIKEEAIIFELHHKISKLIILLVVPAFFSLYNIVEPTIHFFLHEDWHAGIPLMKAFSLTAIIISFGFPSQILMALGYARTVLSTTVLTRLLLVILIIIGISFNDLYTLVLFICPGLIIHNLTINFVAYKKLNRNFIPHFRKALIEPIVLNLIVFVSLKVLFSFASLSYSFIYETVLYLLLMLLIYYKMKTQDLVKDIVNNY